MKKFVFVLVVLAAFSFGTRLMAQDSDDVLFNLELEEVFDIEVYAGDIQTITFASAADYNLGVTEAGGIDPGFSNVSVSATGNWDMTITCPDFTGTGNPVPIGNLGVWIENTGSFVNGIEVEWTCIDAPSCQALFDGDTPIISNLGGNAGDIAENDYVFHWEMGTMQDGDPASPIMIQTSMFDQLQADVFDLGSFTTTATLTITPVP